eukprot:403360956
MQSTSLFLSPKGLYSDANHNQRSLLSIIRVKTRSQTTQVSEYDLFSICIRRGTLYSFSLASRREYKQGDQSNVNVRQRNGLGSRSVQTQQVRHRNRNQSQSYKPQIKSLLNPRETYQDSVSNINDSVIQDSTTKSRYKSQFGNNSQSTRSHNPHSQINQTDYLLNLSRERHNQLQIAQQIQDREKHIFIQERKQKLNQIFNRNRQLIEGIPSTVASEAIKTNFLKMRRNLMIRTIQAEVMKKKMVDWTMPKLIDIAKREERAKNEAQKAKAKLLMGVNNITNSSIPQSYKNDRNLTSQVQDRRNVVAFRDQ